EGPYAELRELFDVQGAGDIGKVDDSFWCGAAARFDEIATQMRFAVRGAFRDTLPVALELFLAAYFARRGMEEHAPSMRICVYYGNRPVHRMPYIAVTRVIWPFVTRPFVTWPFVTWAVAPARAEPNSGRGRSRR